ncbi:ferredoxin [Candidatus Woesearchaeota archaeon]|nr:ferredoxin [Candidatus Woesearchaeota archaeon]
MAKYNVSVDEELCIGCGACISVCDNFDLVEKNDSFKAKAKKTVVADIGCNKDAIDVCPVDAIKIEER